MIYLVRHAIAGRATEGMSDADRALTSAGEEKMRRAAAGLEGLGVAPDVILTSPLRRAEETATVVANVLSSQPPVEIYPPLAPGHDASQVLRGLHRYRSTRELMLVGHEPDMSLLAAQLLTESTALAPLPFKKGAVAAIRVDSVPPRAAGKLLWFMTPKQLRAMAERRA